MDLFEDSFMDVKTTVETGGEEKVLGFRLGYKKFGKSDIGERKEELTHETKLR